MKFSLVIPLASIAAALAIGFAGCGDPPGPDDTQARADSVYEAAMRDLLCELSTNVYTPATADIASHADLLVSAIRNLVAAPTPDNLESARRAWRDARRPWEFFEMGLMDPVTRYDADVAIDAWPVDTGAINRTLQGSVPIDREFLNRQEGKVLGFHAIEYLLWGSDGEKRAEQITRREGEYMSAAADILQVAAGDVEASWNAGTNNGERMYSWQFCHVGEEGSGYQSVREAMTTITNATIALTNDVESSKLGIPYHSPDNTFEESRFSGTTREDLLANLAGVRAWYTGEYRERGMPIVGPGISRLVVMKNPELDAQVRTAIDDAVRYVSEIQPSFGDAILGRNGGNKVTVAVAISSMQNLETLLMNRVLPLFK